MSWARFSESLHRGRFNPSKLLLRVDLLGHRESMIEGLHPYDAPRGHASGYDPDKVLMVGSGPAFGWGVASYELSLCGALARAISERTGRGCDVELLTSADLDARHAGQIISTRRLDRYDAIVIVLGVNDAVRGTSAKSWRSTITGLIRLISSSTTVETDVFFIGVQPIRSIPIYDTFLGGVAELHGAMLNAITEQLCAAEPRAFYLPLPAQDLALGTPDRHRSPAQYAAWAATLSPQIATRLSATIAINGDRRRPRAQADERVRQLTVDNLPFSDLAGDVLLRRLVELAQKSFRVETAQFTISDGQRQFPILSAGIEPKQIEQRDSFYEIALHQREPLIVLDATTDERFKNSPLVTGGPHIRFYAGIPISAPSGERIGALCVSDSHPRLRKDDIDLNFLRELCVFAEKDLWQIVERKRSER